MENSNFKFNSFFLFAYLIVILTSCKKDVCIDCNTNKPIHQTTPYELQIPEGFPPMQIPEDNPMTVEGVELGKKLFHDKILSQNFTQSCQSCHNQEYAFTDNGKKFSEGIDGSIGNRNSMALINLGWNQRFFWDGRAMSLEDQALGPVPNPIEMNLSWQEAEKRLNNHPEYPGLFWKAYGVEYIDSFHVAKAIAQYERTLISGDTKYDRIINEEQVNLTQFSPSELNGYLIFNTEKGDCFHCHGTFLMSSNDFHNNGLDATFTDLGLGEVTQNSKDNGRFKAPTLRNIEFTAPYMHDGRFATLEEVMIQYSFGVQTSSTIDPLMKKAHKGGIELNPQERADVIAFLKTLSDSTFVGLK